EIPSQPNRAVEISWANVRREHFSTRQRSPDANGKFWQGRRAAASGRRSAPTLPWESPVQPDPFPNNVRRIGRRWWQWTVQSNLFQNRSSRRACRTEALRRRKEALISLKYEPRYPGCYGKLKLPQPAGFSFLL